MALWYYGTTVLRRHGGTGRSFDRRIDCYPYYPEYS